MRLKRMLASVFFAISATLSLAASAASDTSAPTQAEASDKAPAAKVSAAKVPARKKAKPHSHMEEKTGIPAKAPEDEKEAKKPLHDHQKEHK